MTDQSCKVKGEAMTPTDYWFHRAAELRGALELLIRQYELLLSELGHGDHNENANPDTVCLDCLAVWEAKKVLGIR